MNKSLTDEQIAELSTDEYIAYNKAEIDHRQAERKVCDALGLGDDLNALEATTEEPR